LDEEEPEPDTPVSSVRSPSWTAWTQPFLASSPVSSPAPTPTFGSVITSPRLRRTTSNLSLLSTASTNHNHDPYAHFGLRIAMPSHTPAPRFPSLSWSHSSSPKARSNRSSSAMYLLGLAGSMSGSQLSQPTPSESGTEVDQSDIE